MGLKKRKTRIEKLDEQISKLEIELLKSPNDKAIQDALYDLKSEQLTVLHRNIQVLDEFMRNERENNF